MNTVTVTFPNTEYEFVGFTLDRYTLVVDSKDEENKVGIALAKEGYNGYKTYLTQEEIKVLINHLTKQLI